MDSVTVPHATQHADLNDAVEALEAKVGVDGSAVTTSLDYQVANQGLTFIKSVTVGSGVSSVTVSDCFSSTFDNYKIVFQFDTFSVNNAAIHFSLGTATNGWYGKMGITAWNGSFTQNQVGAASGYMQIGNTSTTNKSVSSVMDIVRPYISGRTQAYGQHYGNGYVGDYQGSEEFSVSATSFTVAGSAGTMTDGVIRVYGYNNG
jgi:hypothetical protein